MSIEFRVSMLLAVEEHEAAAADLARRAQELITWYQGTDKDRPDWYPRRAVELAEVRLLVDLARVETDLADFTLRRLADG